MELHYEVQGQGASIVLLHSGGADKRDWQFITPLLAQTFEVITFDGRGAGQSPPFTAANYVEDLRQLLDYLGLDTATLVGHSLGGQIATEFALTDPERVSRLVLVASGLSGFQFSRQHYEWIAQVMAVAPDVEHMVARALDAPLYHITMTSPQRDLLVQMTQHNTQRRLEWQTSEVIWPQPPAINRLRKLEVPSLFILGMQDSHDLFRIARLFEQAPDIRFAQVVDADHMVTLTHPEEIFRLVTQFVRG